VYVSRELEIDRTRFGSQEKGQRCHAVFGVVRDGFTVRAVAQKFGVISMPDAYGLTLI
jgi:hypothetical protein